MPKEDKSSSSVNIPLRDEAEKRLSERPGKERTHDDTLSLIHELEVHQIELEMQNEELRRAQLEIEESRQKYVDLYDFGPVGYLTLNEKGMISELNLSAAGLLGIERKSLLNKPFYRFAKSESQDTFYLHRQQVFESSTKQTCELVLKKNDGTFFHAQLDSIGVEINGQRTMRSVLTDVTERKRTEEAQQESDIPLRKLSSWVPGMIYQFLKKPDGTYCVPFTTEAIKDIFGCSPQDVRDDFSPIARVILPEDFAKVVGSIEYSAKHLTIWACEYRVQIPGQSIRWMFGKSTPEKLPDGSIIWYGFNTDITKRKKAEEIIKLNEMRLEGLLRISHYRAETIQEFVDYALHEAIALTRSKIGYISFYDEEKRQFILNTWSKEVMKECTVFNPKTIHELDKTGIWGEAVRQREPIMVNDFQAPHPLKKGYPEGHAKLYKYLTIPVFVDNKIVAVVAVANKATDYEQSDIRQLTLLMDSVWRYIDREKTASALKESEDKYRSIFENAVEGISQTTLEGRYISANPAHARMLGYDTPEELIKAVTDLSKQGYVNPEDRVRFKKILAEQGSIQGFEARHYRKDGSIIWVSISSRVVRDPTGKVLYYEGTLEDITARKKAEEELRQHTEKLRKSLLGTIKAISLTVEARDPYTSGHQRKVSNLARAIAQDMALSDDTVDTIRLAGIIHDIGKISVPAEILSKPGILTNIEMDLIRVHPQSGYDILEDTELPYPIAETVLQHHERLDGSGYPQGLKNDQILLESRIIAVADVVEAIASHRPYRPARGIDAALEEIEKNKGILYDAGVVEVCLQLFREKEFRFD